MDAVSTAIRLKHRTISNTLNLISAAFAIAGTLALMWHFGLDPFSRFEHSCAWILFAARNGIR